MSPSADRRALPQRDRAARRTRGVVPDLALRFGTTIYHLPASSQSSASNIKFIPRLPLCAGLEIDNFLLLMLLELMKGTFRNNDLQHIPHPDLPTHWDSQESNLTRNKCVLCALYCVLCPCFEVFLKF